ncbi:hypothetical protein [Denitrobaculum tricleocarpae]|uniref:Lipoprotein n=1 Tax=Denitrobaculum tricleocarpae TaxID=2591009 RepID=A0A545TSX6_9PROT|nr:hypothetical protein [Denitrobaculum tricleocarpae]TQV80312.1 hypothetical protein FKG95_08950 [Denitrobaculum tricleocarpae]
MKIFGVLAALWAAFLLSACSTTPVPEPPPAPVVAQPACKTPSQIVAEVPADISVLAYLTGSRAIAFMNAYNEMPPRSFIRADEVLILQKAGVTSVAVLRFMGGCAQRFGIHPRKLVRDLMAEAFGPSA